MYLCLLKADSFYGPKTYNELLELFASITWDSVRNSGQYANETEFNNAKQVTLNNFKKDFETLFTWHVSSTTEEENDAISIQTTYYTDLNNITANYDPADTTKNVKNIQISRNPTTNKLEG